MRYKKKQYSGQTPYEFKPKGDATPPTKPRVDSESSTLGQIAFKDLNTVRPITIYANPTDQATRSAVPYAIINGTNKVFETEYPGSKNTAGNVIPQLANSNSSKFLDLMDCGKIDLELNYLYAAIKPTDYNQALNVQMGKSMDEALSKAYSELFIELPFFKDTITSDMINCDASNRTQAFIWYQTMLQNIACIPAKYNMLMSLEQHIKDMCYNRNVAPLDDLFGLLKKAAFKAKLTAFSQTITGEYFDMNWFKQVNTLTMVPSRKTNSMRDPLLIIDAIHKIPSILIKAAGDTEVLNSTKYDIEIEGTQTKFEYVIKRLVNLLSPYNILKWARQYTEGSGDFASTTPTVYFNTIVETVELLRKALNRFPSDVAEIRTVLDTANRVGMNRWSQGIYFELTRDNTYNPIFNKLCHDVFVNYLAAPDAIKFNETTQRWGFYSLWDEFLGIPKYDRVNGGSFLTFSTRKVTGSPSTDTKALIPQLFTIPSDEKANFVNRKGIIVDLTYTTMNSTAIDSSAVYSRLNALNSSDYSQRIPTANLSSGYSGIPQLGSAIEYLLARLFGLGNIKISSSVTNSTLNSEIICAIDVEMEDITNAMIAYAQAYAPFKVYSPTTTKTVGFIDSPSIVK